MPGLLVRNSPADGKLLEIGQARRSVCHRIAGHAARTPSRAAVVYGGDSLSYAELDRQSDQIAARLRDHGAGSECCIGLLLERSPRFVVAALAVLKCGAAYLPLDFATPPERLAYILADSAAALLLTEGHPSLPSNTGCPVVDIAPLVAAPAGLIPMDDVETSLDSLAYVIYTSGSTGRPKGVEITQANLLNLIDWHQAAFGVTESDRSSQIAGLGFDAAVWEIWPTLTAGACLHIANEQTRRSAPALRDFLVAEKITICFAPTLLAEQLLSMTWPAETALRTLLTGADTLRRRPTTRLPFVLVNNYGPTECTVVATSGVVAADDGHEPPTIGQPISNTTAVILDEDRRPVPPGEAGELCLAGALVGRGYRNDPALTAERFIHCSMTPGGDPLRVYCTGDRARLLPGGEIAFLGRLDEQVKIRGYRVELGEIAACLNRCPGIVTCAVAVRAASDVPALIAYVVLTSDGNGMGLTENDLQEFLAPRLPDYMIPASFVHLAELPVTANGKLDRSALPAPTAEKVLLRRGAAALAEAAVNSTEGLQQQLAGLVASLLGQPAIDIDQDFFLVGGHSMFGVQLLARIKDSFGIRLTLRQLFSTPTVAGLAAEIVRQTDNRR
jgi:amino acid adenylation domain-containing protein